MGSSAKRSGVRTDRNQHLSELDALSPRIALVGGGYIGAEFSHVAARSGARVTVLQHVERMLPGFDPDLTPVEEDTDRILRL